MHCKIQILLQMNDTIIEKRLKFDGINIMGIINVTPDSFYDKSRVATAQLALEKAVQFVNEGVDIIDIGGLSSRPNATLISEEEEISKVIPAIQLIHQHFPHIPISIDSFRAKVVQQALQAGATIVNDISGGSFDENLLQVVAKNNAPYICMHVMGNFSTMHSTKLEGNIMPHIIDYFTKKIRVLHNLGIKNIIIDPGIGFSKSIPQNFEIIKNIFQLKQFNVPILLGISRKSFIYKSLQILPADALPATTALHFFALQQGVNILRVHDVAAAKQMIEIGGFL